MIGKLKALAPYAALFAGAVYLYRDAGSFAAAARPGQLGPDFWPRAVLVLLMIVCGVEVLRRLLFARAAHDESSEPHPGADAPGESSERFPWRLAGGIAVTIAYVLVLDRLGFFVATALYLALFMVLGRYARMRVIASANLLGSLAFVFVFMKIVYVSLPLGVGPFQAISVWLLAMLGIR